MPTIQSLEAFNDLMKQLANAVHEAVTGETIPNWTSAILDVRSPPSGGSQSMKLRVSVPDEPLRSVETTDDIEDRIFDMWKCKGPLFKPSWYGLKLTVTPEGDCQVDFNYDPKCDEDDSFYLD